MQGIIIVDPDSGEPDKNVQIEYTNMYRKYLLMIIAEHTVILYVILCP